MQDYVASPSAYYQSISNASLDGNEQRFRTGKYGETLDAAYDPKKYESGCKIVFIGESSTESRWMDEKARWPAQVEENLQQDGVNATVFNFGVGGQNLNQSLLRYISFIAEISPDLVLVMHEANDVSKMLKGGYYVKEGDLHNSYSVAKGKLDFVERLKGVIYNTVPLTAETLRNLRNERAIDVDPPKRKESAEFSGLSSGVAAGQFSRRVLALNELVKSHSGSLIFIEYPQIYENILETTDDGYSRPVKDHIEKRIKLNGITNEFFLTYHSEFRRRVKEYLSSQKIEIIPTPKFLEKKYFYDATHFNKKGAKKFARYISNQIPPNFCTR